MRLVAVGRAGRAALPPRGACGRQLPDELRRGDRDRRASFDQLVAQAASSGATKVCPAQARPRPGRRSIVTGLVVEFALIPMALFHFHRSGLYGVAANIVAIPADDLRHHAARGRRIVARRCRTGAVPSGSCAAIAIDALALARPHRRRGQRRRGDAAVDARLGIRPDGCRWALAMPVDRRACGGSESLRSSPAPWARPSHRHPICCVTGDGRHLAIVGDGGAPLILRERAGDYVRDLLAEASGFDGDPVELGSRPFSACSKDACVALIRQRLSRSGACSRPARQIASTGPG